MDRDADDSMASAWARRTLAVSDASDVGELLVSFWTQVDAALRPVIGPHGVAALYWRSLRLTSARHVWMLDAGEGSDRPADMARLLAVFAMRERDDAVSAGGMLLATFQDVLVTLIGPQLTDRLLGSVWAADAPTPPICGPELMP